MSNPSTAEQEKRWSRPLLERTGPVRTAGGFFRTAECGRNGLGGIPLTAAEDAVVAAVRMAYKVAETQVERSARLAQRLREAGDRAIGPHSDRAAVDATEQLVLRAGMSALSWIEAAAAEPGSPLKRLLLSQYRLVGSMLGLTQAEEPRSSRHDGPEMPKRGMGPTSFTRRELNESNASLRRVEIVLKGEHRRPVRTRRFEIKSDASVDEHIKFYSAKHIDSDPLAAQIFIDAQNHARLMVEVQRLAPPGLWKAAICDKETVQVGMIEIEL